MKHPFPIACTVLFIPGIIGCPNASKPLTNVAPMPAPVPVTPSSAIPSSQATGIWNQGQVEQWLKQELKLTELALTGSENGNYTGQGRDATGKSFQLNVMQVPGGIACEHTSGPGSSGRIAFGNPISREGQPVVTQPVTAVSSSTVQIPDAPVSGKIHGLDFAIESAVLENGVLTLRQGKDAFPDLALDVMMFIQQGEPAAGKKVHIVPNQPGNKPWLRLQWREAGQGRTADFQNNYSLTLEFGQIQDGKLPGKIHAMLPDESKSSVSGTFVLQRMR